MGVIGKTHRLWVARDVTNNNELVALVHSMYDVPDADITAVTNVKWLVVRALDIYNKRPWIEIRSDFTEVEWETWHEFDLVPVIKITKAGVDKPHRWETTVK